MKFLLRLKHKISIIKPKKYIFRKLNKFDKLIDESFKEFNKNFDIFNKFFNGSFDLLNEPLNESNKINKIFDKIDISISKSFEKLNKKIYKLENVIDESFEKLNKNLDLFKVKFKVNKKFEEKINLYRIIFIIIIFCIIIYKTLI